MPASLRLLHLLSLGLWIGSVVLPQASRARAALGVAQDAPAHDEAQARFDALHRRSVLLNGTVLLLGVAAFALAVVERSPL